MRLKDKVAIITGGSRGIGYATATALVKGQLQLDKGGYIVANESTQADIPGVYAIGDVRTKAVRQIVTAVAVHMAEEYLSGNF